MRGHKMGREWPVAGLWLIRHVTKSRKPVVKPGTSFSWKPFKIDMTHLRLDFEDLNFFCFIWHRKMASKIRWILNAWECHRTWKSAVNSVLRSNCRFFVKIYWKDLLTGYFGLKLNWTSKIDHWDFLNLLRRLASNRIRHLSFP